ncbi:MAG: 3-keto-5-aminohexanoate cleavage protein [Vicinamibacterales bacterium]
MGPASLTPFSGPLVINVALTGMVARRRDHPAIPEQPEEIAADVAACAAAGAATVHLHIRDSDGAPDYRRARYAETIRAVRAAAPDVVVCVSTSGRTFTTFEQRSDVLDLDPDVAPELASLTLGSLNFPKQASVNEPATIQRLAARMHERGIVPELEIFDLGMVDYAHYLIGRGLLNPPFVFNLLLGSLGTLAATPVNLALLVERLPAGAYWQAAGISRAQWPMNALAVVTGGHVRTGVEDNLWMDADTRVPATNPALVRRVAALACAVGRPLATPALARELMGLPPRS